MSLGMADVPDAPPDAGRILLSRARRECDPVMRVAVGWLAEPLATMAGYHLGWWDVNGSGTGGWSGRATRAALVVWAAAACGDASAAAPVAAAVELMHNFSLVHDDVMDRDVTRRGRATVWTVWGETSAIMLGDALHVLCSRVLAEMLAPEVAMAAIATLESSFLGLRVGQVDDGDFETPKRVTVDGYLRMAAGKTAGLMGCACEPGGADRGCGSVDGIGDAGVRLPPGAGLSDPRRHRRHLGRSICHRQAGRQRSGPPQENSAGDCGVGVRLLGGAQTG